jgi:hypothetical protein
MPHGEPRDVSHSGGAAPDSHRLPTAWPVHTFNCRSNSITKCPLRASAPYERCELRTARSLPPLHRAVERMTLRAS